MFDEFSGTDLANIPRSRRKDSSENTDDEADEVGKPVYPDPSTPEVFKIIHTCGEGNEKPGNLDKVSIELQTPDPIQKLLSLPEESKPFSTLIQSMRKNEVSEFHIQEEPVCTLKLLDWTSIKDLLEDGSLIKTIQKRGLGYDLIEYKDDVRISLKLFTPLQEISSKELELSCEIPLIPSGLFEILKSMKLLEESLIKSSKSRYEESFCPDPNFPPIDSEEIFLELKILDLKKVEDMYLDGSFYKKHAVEGEGKNLPNPNALVRIFYKLEIAGNVVLSNFDEETLEIRMDEDEVPSLWTHCLRQMKEGDVVKVECNMLGLHSHYLNDGLNARFNYETYAVPEVHSCTFFISLHSFDMGKVNYNMTYEDRVVEANRIKEAGNKLFKIQRFEKALEKYESANSSLEPITDCPHLLRPVSLLLFGNMTLCNLRMEKWHEAETHARKILEFNPSDVRALVRRAQARIQLENYEAAGQDLKNAKATCEEKNDLEQLAVVNKELSRLSHLAKNTRGKEKKMYSKLFS
jgi:hypothetical protein